MIKNKWSKKLILAVGLGAFLLSGCDQPSGPSSDSDKASAKINNSPKKDTSSITLTPVAGNPEPQPIDPSHVLPLDSVAVVVVSGTGVTECDTGNGIHSQPIQPVTGDPGSTVISPRHPIAPVGDSSTVPPGCTRVGYANGSETGPYSGTVVCPIK